MFVLGENHFRKCGCLVGPKNRIFRKLISVDRKKKGFDYGNEFPFLFSLQMNSGERERERASERARGRRGPRALVQSDDCWRTPSSNLHRLHAPVDLASSSPTTAPSIAIGAVLCEIVIDASRDQAIDCDLAFALIAISRSTALIAISAKASSRSRIAIDSAGACERHRLELGACERRGLVMLLPLALSLSLSLSGIHLK